MKAAEAFGVSARWERIGGGLSGADVFAGSLAGVRKFALKAWPSGTSSETIDRVHAWMIAAAPTGLVPHLLRAAGRTHIHFDGRAWECADWVPGEPLLLVQPTPARLHAACEALRKLHAAWAEIAPQSAAFPGVARRLELLARGGGFVEEPLRQAAMRGLQPWAGQVVPVQPCLCDVHAGHVLFAGERVAGVIDYGAMKLDHPAVDFARLYGDVGEPPAEELVRALAFAGTVGALVHWAMHGHPPPGRVAKLRDNLRRMTLGGQRS